MRTYLLAALLILICLIPYLPSLHTFFANDDWAVIHFYGELSLVPPTEFFNPHTLWFYRPLQSILYQLLYHTFGLQELYFNLTSWGMFLLFSLLWCALLMRLFKSSLLALLALFFFLTNWEYCDLIFWKANFGTHLSALGIMASLLLFFSYLKQQRPAYLMLSLAAFLFALLSKETSVHLPLLVVLVYLFHPGAQDKPTLKGLIKITLPFWLLLLVYLVFHFLFVRDIETITPKGYYFSSPLAVLRNWLFALNHLLFYFVPSPLLPQLNPFWEFIRNYCLFIPLLIVYLSWRHQQRILLFALAFSTLALFPAVLIKDFHASRFYLLPAAAMGLLWARLILLAFHYLEGKTLLKQATRILLILFILFATLSSELKITYHVSYDRANTELIRSFYLHLKANRHHYPSDSLFIFRNITDDVANQGLGLRQMVKLALESEQAEAIKEDAPIPEAFADFLQTRYTQRYFIYLNPKGTVVSEELPPP